MQEQHLARQAAMREAAEFGMIGLLNTGAGGDPNAIDTPIGPMPLPAWPASEISPKIPAKAMMTASRVTKFTIFQMPSRSLYCRLNSCSM